MKRRLFGIYPVCLAMLCAAGSAGVRAADSFSINVTGKIMPAACVVSIEGGGNFDYGLIDKKSLVGSTNKILPVKSAGLTISCPAPTKLGLRGSDNRDGTQIEPNVPALLFPGALFGKYTWQNAFGLGLDPSGNPVGLWTAHLTSLSTESEPTVKHIYGRPPGSWSDLSPEFTFFNGNYAAVVHSVSRPDETTPLAFTTLQATLEVRAAINRPHNLDLSRPVALDGSMTVELVYL